MSDTVFSFNVRDLLTDSNRYIIPMYQRNYAWGEGEINQLIQDVLDIQQKHQSDAHKPPYYIGTLVVFERADGRFEVIDGQQRFTTLTLMAMCLKRMMKEKSHSINLDWYEKPNLEFESRAKSSLTLTSLSQGVPLDKLHHENYNIDVVNGFSLLEKALLALKTHLNDFCDYLFNHVQITRVPVPKDTDLNHYFEVMNNRGEQLEKHEVVKARLMSVLNDIDDATTRKNAIHTLSKVWEATANMERYVQYGFTPEQRHKIFGNEDWGLFTPVNFASLSRCLSEQETNAMNKTEVSKSLLDILVSSENSPQQDENPILPERFNSVINFSNFLLHVLRVWTEKDIPLDDKQLLEQFESHILKAPNPIDSTQEFIFALLKTKYLFDQYIIKREFTEGEDKWSLKRLHFYNKNSQSYINSFDRDEDSIGDANRRVLMLLSALHVSTPTLVYKHWLNGALKMLYDMQDIEASDYLFKLENLSRQFVYGRFLKADEDANYYNVIYKKYAFASIDFNQTEVSQRLRYGKIENNLVFNYLDYLLWVQAIDKNTSDDVIRQFEFTVRSSVEHFYPQHPMDGHAKLDDSNLHSFGNLCLISHSKNSRLSNFQPKAKRDHFKAAISDKSIDSLKLYEMIKLMDASNSWGRDEIEQHERSMLDIFAADSSMERGQ